MSQLIDFGSIPALHVWQDVNARIVQGDRITMALVHLPPGGLVPEHRHENEQLGLCLDGSVTFRVGDETREFGPGGTWRILANIPHEVKAGDAGAVVVDVFSPIRSDWAGLEQAPDAPLRWPA